MVTEREKMLRGELYDASDPELVGGRRRARDLLKAFNESCDAERELRLRILRQLLGSMGEGVWIEPPFYCDYGSQIVLGSQVYFNFNCIILDVMPVEIGDYVLLGPAVQIYTATHPMGHRQRRTLLEYGKPVRIGSDVWIGGGAIVNPGATIGDRTVIASGSVVTRDIPSDVFAAGSPCVVVRDL